MDITNIVAIIGVILVALCGFCIQRVSSYLKKCMTKEQLEELYELVQIGVKAAEQLYQSGQLAKSYRTRYVYAYLEEYGITFDEEVVKNMIESAVLELPKILQAEALTTTEEETGETAEETSTTEGDEQSPD